MAHSTTVEAPPGIVACVECVYEVDQDLSHLDEQGKSMLFRTLDGGGINFISLGLTEI